jgi:acyl-CoA synthetase (AMP-forming)/AMP-acid ligase II/acyl carrier protein
MSEGIREQIWRLVREVSGNQAHVTDPSDPSEPLADLDSLALVTLIVRLEERFGRSISAEVMTSRSFTSIASIASLISDAEAEPIKAGPAEPIKEDLAETLTRPDLAVSGRSEPSAGRSEPSVYTILDCLQMWADIQPDAPFLTWIPNEGSDELLSYGELDRRTSALAAQLNSGLNELDADEEGRHRIGLLAANDIQTVVALFAIIRAGHVCLFLSPDDPAERILSILAAHPVSMVLRSDQVEGFDGIGVVARDLADADPAGAANDPVPADPAFIFGTSGSTAVSKFVVQSHRALLSNAQDLRRHHALGPSVTIAGGLPLHHVNGVHFTLLAVLEAGAHVVIPQNFSPLTYLSCLDVYRPAIASVVPSILESLLITGSAWRPPESFRYFVSAAAPLSASLATRVYENFGRRVIQGYGLTETTNFSTMLPVDLCDDEYAEIMLRADIPTVGLALPCNQVEVLSNDGDVLGENVAGEICMRGDNIMTGYLGEPGMTSEALAGGWFHSGDLGWWRREPDDRRYFVLTGRIKNVAKIRGESVSLEEVERLLCSFDEVADAGCVAVPHDLWGEQLVAVVAVSAPVSIHELSARLALLVPRVALPHRWLTVESVPRTPTGKLMRGELRKQVANADCSILDLQ